MEGLASRVQNDGISLWRCQMAERLVFLNKAYSAYYHRGVPPADDELTRVGPGIV